MKKLLFILFGVLFLSCSTLYSGRYLVDANCSNIKMLPNNNDIFIFEDSIIKIGWSISPFVMNFNLTNKTNKVIRVIWDEASFSDIDGNSSHIIHSGIRYMDMNNSHPSTSIAPYSNISDLMQPTNNIHIDNVWSGWKQNPILPNAASTKTNLSILSNKYIGKKMTVVLPIKIDDKIHEYVFYFNINGFVKK